MEKALADFKLGNPIIVLDDTDRENEADIIIPAQFATTAMINKFIRNSTGIICVPMTESKAVQLGLTQMVTNNTDPNGTNYTITCDAVNCGTGVSAEDRTKTILTLADPNSDKSKVRTPGHIFGLVAKPGLLNQRRGHTEASIQLCLLANLEPISVIVELMNPDGTMTRLDDISKNPALEDIPVISIKDIITYSTAGFYIPKPPLYTSECNLVINLNGIPTTFKTILFKDYFIGEEICVLQFGDIGEETYLRIHSECFTGNTLHSMHCDCEEQFLNSLNIISKESGILLYMRNHEGRGIGLFNKLKAYKLQDEQKLDTIQANIELGFIEDYRNYETAITVLEQLGVKKLKLITNNPQKLKAISSKFQTRMINFKSIVNPHNAKYLDTKRDKMGHF